LKRLVCLYRRKEAVLVTVRALKKSLIIKYF
jgi:hypothetical protein